jgi:hypothetical protein
MQCHVARESATARGLYDSRFRKFVEGVEWICLSSICRRATGDASVNAKQASLSSEDEGGSLLSLSAAVRSSKQGARFEEAGSRSQCEVGRSADPLTTWAKVWGLAELLAGTITGYLKRRAK